MELKGVKIGFAITGSFCTLDKILLELEKLRALEAEVFPIFSNSVSNMDTRFGEAYKFRERVEEITGNRVIDSILGAEPIGPKGLLDILTVAPCTGNTIAKIAAGITDTPVTMAVKAHGRNLKPIVISVSSNDALAANLKNIGILMNTRNYYFVPFGQDDYVKKPNSLVARVDLLTDTLSMALDKKQIQPVLVA